MSRRIEPYIGIGSSHHQLHLISIICRINLISYLVPVERDEKTRKCGTILIVQFSQQINCDPFLAFQGQQLAHHSISFIIYYLGIYRIFDLISYLFKVLDDGKTLTRVCHHVSVVIRTSRRILSFISAFLITS